MRKFATLVAAAGLAASVVAAGPAAQDPPAGFQGELTVASGETATHEAPAGGGGTTLIFGSSPECGEAPEDKCDKILVEFTGTGEASFVLDAAYDPADFDVTVYASDADGTIGDEVASSGNFYFPVDAGFGLAPVESGTFAAKRGEYYAVVVYYFAAGGGYRLDVSLA